ncbi:MAG: energy-coupling factor transporter transmembrane protein EcfT [Clostridia bacterium]|nr:energy-coupling factor transporter transmembrane protein EcfT [Clostridia bacterium]
MNSIAFGQYYQASSGIHRMDPRTKIIAMLLFIVATFLCKNILSFALLILFTVVLSLLSRVPMRLILKSIRGVVFIIILAALVNLFLTSTEGATMIWRIGEWNGREYGITQEGILRAVCMVIRILCLISGTSILLTFTTTPIEMTDGLSQLLSPLMKIKIPVDLFAMMMSIALRFIPTLIEDTRRIMNAQKARGTDFSSGGLIKKAKALIPILIPLFVSSFKRGEELATAMECRCYHGGAGRTRMNKLHWKVSDTMGLLLFALLIGAVIVLNLTLRGVTPAIA